MIYDPRLASSSPLTGRTLRWWCVRRRTDISVDSPMSAAEGEKTFREHFRLRWGREVDGPLLQAQQAKAYPLALITRSTHRRARGSSRAACCFRRVLPACDAACRLRGTPEDPDSEPSLLTRLVPACLVFFSAMVRRAGCATPGARSRTTTTRTSPPRTNRTRKRCLRKPPAPWLSRSLHAPPRSSQVLSSLLVPST